MYCGHHFYIFLTSQLLATTFYLVIPRNSLSLQYNTTVLPDYISKYTIQSLMWMVYQADLAGEVWRTVKLCTRVDFLIISAHVNTICGDLHGGRNLMICDFYLQISAPCQVVIPGP